jgi:hypothetical protein
LNDLLVRRLHGFGQVRGRGAGKIAKKAEKTGKTVKKGLDLILYAKGAKEPEMTSFAWREEGAGLATGPAEFSLSIEH